jgi:hypothetical protein
MENKQTTIYNKSFKLVPVYFFWRNLLWKFESKIRAATDITNTVLGWKVTSFAYLVCKTENSTNSGGSPDKSWWIYFPWQIEPECQSTTH